MTKDEKRKIESFRVAIISTGILADHVKLEMENLGFTHIHICDWHDMTALRSYGAIIIDVDTLGFKQPGYDIPVIYPFDFIEGGAVIVMEKGEDQDMAKCGNPRLWAARYISGYCAFWNIVGNDWLHMSMGKIADGKTNDDALKTSAYICAKIVANMAVGHEVKRFPRFYLCRNLQ